MKFAAVAAILLCFASELADGLPQQPVQEVVVGAPCTLQTDIDEGTCDVQMRVPQKWKTDKPPSWRMTWKGSL